MTPAISNKNKCFHIGQGKKHEPRVGYHIFIITYFSVRHTTLN